MKFRVIVEDASIDETFDTKEEARKYLLDQYDNWYYDDEDIAEQVYQALSDAENDNWKETDECFLIEV